MPLFDKRRKQYVVDPSFQIGFMITWVVMTLLFITVILVGLVIGLRWIKESPTYGLEEMGFMLRADAIFIILFTIAVAIYFIILSHRIAGPAFRLKKSIKDILAGNYDFNVSLRQKDYLKHVADDLNKLLVILRENQNIIKTIAQNTQELKKKLNQNTITPEVSEVIDKIEQDIKKLLPKN